MKHLLKTTLKFPDIIYSISSYCNYSGSEIPDIPFMVHGHLEFILTRFHSTAVEVLTVRISLLMLGRRKMRLC